MNKTVITRLSSLALFVSSTFAGSCSLDQQQMHNQIQTYASVSTNACPMHDTSWSFVYPSLGAGIVTISDPMQYGDNCYARCYYADMNGQAVSCDWQAGNWGDTLSCY